MRDLEDERDAVDLAAVTGDDVAASSSDVPQQRTESAGGGVDFRAAPPAADTEDIARRVRASDGEVVLLHGGLVEGGDSADATAVLAGIGSPEGLFFCELADKTGAGTEALASPGVAVSPDGRRAFFHGGYKVWDDGNDFADADDLSVFDGDESRWSCAGASCGGDELGGATAVPVTPGRRDEHVAVITPEPIELGDTRQRAMVVFGGRDETDARLDTVYALGLDDMIWREMPASPPATKKGRVADQGPFDLPAVIRRSHLHGEPYPLARSGAAAVVSPDNVMFVHGGFVVEGRLGFNVGELLALDLNTFEFFYPKTSGDLPVRRNKHTAVIDDRKRMWVWGGSVWDHTGGSATYASTATHVADVSDPSRVTWTRVETKGLPPSQRRLHSAVHRDGVMYIIGGEDYHSKQYLQDVHALDLETLTWSQPAVAGNARGGRIRAAAARVRVGDPARALAGCGEGESAPAITGELQPKSDKLVTALEETSAAMGRPFAAAMGKRSEDGDADAVRAGWVPRPARGASDAHPGVGLLVESRAMWELHLLARVAGEGLLEVREEDLPEFSRGGEDDDGAEGRDDAVVGDDGWAIAPNRKGVRDSFKIETKLADAMAARADEKDIDDDSRWDDDVASQWAEVLGDDDEVLGRSTEKRRGRSRSRSRSRSSSRSHRLDEDADAVAEQGLRSKKRAKADDEALDDFGASSARVDESSRLEAEAEADKAAKTAAEASRREAEDDVRVARAVAERDAARASEGKGPKLRFESKRRGGGGGGDDDDAEDADALDPSRIAKLADSAYAEVVREDKRRSRRESRGSRGSLGGSVKSEPEEEVEEALASAGATVEGSRLSSQRLREAALGESREDYAEAAALGAELDHLVSKLSAADSESSSDAPSLVGDESDDAAGPEAAPEEAEKAPEEAEDAYDASAEAAIPGVASSDAGASTAIPSGLGEIRLASLGDAAPIDAAPREMPRGSTTTARATEVSSPGASSPLGPDDDYEPALGPTASPAEALDALFADEPAPSEILDLPGTDYDYDYDDAETRGTVLDSNRPRAERESRSREVLVRRRVVDSNDASVRDSASLGARTSSDSMSVEQRASEKVSEFVATWSGAAEGAWGHAEPNASESESVRPAFGSANAMLAFGAAAALAAAGAFGMREAARGAARGTAAERVPLVGGLREGGGLVGATPLAPSESPAAMEEGAWQKAAAARWQHHLGDPYDGIDEEEGYYP